MGKLRREDLSQYVSRVIKQKGMKTRDVAERSGKRISGGYVSGIMTGKESNPSVEKLKALAQGLEVDVRELFEAALGPSYKPSPQQQSFDPSGFLDILDLLHKIFVNPQLLEIMQSLAESSERKQTITLKMVEKLQESRQKPRRRGGST